MRSESKLAGTLVPWCIALIWGCLLSPVACAEELALPAGKSMEALATDAGMSFW